MAVHTDGQPPSPDAELRSLIARSDSRHQTLIRSVRTGVRKRFPTANELVYDYSRFFVISYSPTHKPYDGIVTISARADGVRLYFMHGPQLLDPKKLLRGSGKETRYVRIESASTLTHPDVEALIAAAIERATVPLPPDGKGNLIIKSTAAKKRAAKASR